MKRIKSKKARVRKRLVLVVALLTSTLGIGTLTYFHFWHKVPSPSSSVGDINLAPATAEDKQYNDQHKEDISSSDSNNPSTTPDSSDQSSTSSNTLKTVTPIITYAGTSSGNVMVSAYITGLIENGGKCTLTLTKDSSSVTKQVDGIANASDTSCPSMNIPTEQLSEGTWSAVVSYSSSAAMGTSSSKNIEVNQ